MLDDGSYDAIVVDATDTGGDIDVELTVLAGPHKGEVVTVSARRLGREAIDLLGVPATLVVTAGQPSLHLEG